MGGSASNISLGAPSLGHEPGRMSGKPRARLEREVVGSATASRPGGVSGHLSGWLSITPAYGPSLLSPTRPDMATSEAGNGAEADGALSGALEAEAASLAVRCPVGSYPAEPDTAPGQAGLDGRAVVEELSPSQQSPSTATCNVQGPAALAQAEVGPAGTTKIDDDEDVIEGESRSRASPQATSLTGLPLTWPLVYRLSETHESEPARTKAVSWRVRLLALVVTALACAPGASPCSAASESHGRRHGNGLFEARSGVAAQSIAREVGAAEASRARSSGADASVKSPDFAGAAPKRAGLRSRPPLCRDGDGAEQGGAACARDELRGDAAEGRERSANRVALCIECEDEELSELSRPRGAVQRAVLAPGASGATKRRRKRGERSLLTRTAWATWLQNWWRRVLRMRAAVGKASAPWLPGDWGRCAPWWRLRTQPRCLSGPGLASGEELDAQAERAREVTMWYSQYARILKKLTKRTPTAISGYCGGGGSDEGVRRCGGTSVGFDMVEQPEFRRRFGEESFSLGDGIDQEAWRSRDAAARAFLWTAGPPCKWYSTGRAGEPTQPPLITETRDVLMRGGRLWWIENVLGAVKHMASEAVVLRGCHFGLRVDRGRRFEANFPVHVDAALRAGEALRPRTCLGERRRWLRMDPYGRPVREPCCAGNLFAIQGAGPTGSTLEENAAAMGVDGGHMGWARLSQAIPPAYAELLFGQAAMEEAHRRFGVPRITHDEMVARPSWARSVLGMWLRGAGAASSSAGLGFEPMPSAAARETRAAFDLAADGQAYEAPPSLEVGAAACAAPGWGDADWALSEERFRELYYTHAGGYEQTVLGTGAPNWLAAFTAAGRVEATAAALAGRNTYVHVRPAEAGAALEAAIAALRATPRGTRVTMVLAAGEGAGTEARGVLRRARAAGFTTLRHYGRCEAARWCGEVLRPTRAPGEVTVLSAGRRRSTLPTMQLDRERSRAAMDDIDAGRAPKEDGDLKHQRSWEPIELDASVWHGKGLPDEVVSMMTEGVRVSGPPQAGYYEIPQYQFVDAEHELMGAAEADRALAVGACEYVPDEMIDELERDCVVHPWLVVHQSLEKWRACQDYKHGTNLFNESPPFHLPSVWEARRVVKPGSYFAKYDLRDGFWHVPVAAADRRRLLVRHPMSGRLMWASRLPFGFLRSPERFCLLTQSLADLFHRRHPGIGVHLYVFVDDYLVIGDDEAATRRGCALLEELFAEFGMQWAPHKRRGPAQVMEFLGLLLCNLEGMRCVALTESRERKVQGMLTEWLALRPRPGDADLQVDPTELARLLGNLVFASQAVRGGRTAMMAMLLSFKGVVVDWSRGEVRAPAGEWRGLRVGAGFWRDVEWWHDHLSERACVPMVEPELGVAVVAGTDASGWGYGNLVWLDGHRSETQLRFTSIERGKPINWRELLGSVRIVETWGRQLRGRTLLIETDNMSARCAAGGMKSKAEDMQELVRRLLAACEDNEIELRMTHTPGAKLDRPDQTSRGDAAEEPRQRLSRAAFEPLAVRAGGFSEFLGAERWHDQRPTVVGRVSLWVHPAVHTVASAIRLVAGRIRDAGNGTINGCLVVPFQPLASWWSLTQHFVFEGLLLAGSGLEENRLGSWFGLRARATAAVFSFSRRSGAEVRAVHLGASGVGVVEEHAGMPGYAFDAREPARWRRPLLVGALVVGRGPSRAWRLYAVREAYDAIGAREVLLSELEVGYRVVGTEQALVRVVANEHALGRCMVTRPADEVYEVGGSLYTLTERPGRNDIVRRTYDVQWALACRMADAADGARAELSGAVEDGAGPSVGELASVGWGALDGHAQSPLLSGGPRSASTAAEEDEPFRPAPGVRTVESPPSSAGSRGSRTPPQRAGRGRAQGVPDARGEVEEAVVQHEAPSGLAEGVGLLALRPTAGAAQVSDDDGLARLTAEVEALGLDEPYDFASREEEEREEVRSGEERAALRARAVEARAAERGGEDDEDVREGGYLPFVGPPLVPEKAVGRGLVPCKQRSLVCEGCDLHIDQGSWMRQGKRSWVHDSDVCEDSACAQHRARLAASEGRRDGEAAREPGRSTGPAPPRSEAGYTIAARKLALDNSYGDERLGAIVACMRGECDCESEPDLQCARACGRALHSSCAGVGKAAALGTLVCVWCRLRDAKASEPASAAVVRMAAKQLVLELLSRKESTARSNLDVERMQQLFLNEVLAEGGTMAKPVDNPAAMAAYLFWIIESGRGSQLEGHVVKLGSYLKDTGRDDAEKGQFLMKHPQVARALKRVKELNPSEPLPMTSGTRSLAGEILATIPLEASTKFLAAREAALFSLECVGGARIGEIAGAQVGHGVFANHLSVISWVGEHVGPDGVRLEWPPPVGVSAGERFVEHDNETSKTGVPRVMCLPGTTEGPANIHLADTVEVYWEAAGIEVDEVLEGGWLVRKPDFWVAQIPLLGIHRNAKRLSVIRRWFAASRVPQVREKAAALGRELTRLTTSKDPSDAKGFLNVAGGREASDDLAAVVAELDALGVRTVVAPGPLLMKTAGSNIVGGEKESVVLPMPILVKSTYDFIGKVTKRAFEKIGTEGGDPDLVLGKGRKAPRFAHHSWRRLADTTAEECLAAGKCTETDIELHFGWRLKIHKKSMLLHYAGRGKRTARAKVVKGI